VSARRASATGFDDSVQLLRLIADAIDAEIFVKDLAGVYRFVNRAFRRGYGFEARQILGQDDHALFPPDVAARFRESDRRIATSGVAETFEEGGELRRRHVTYRVNKVPLRNRDGEVFAICGVGFDISTEKERERDLCDLLDRLQSLHDEVRILRGILPFCCFCKRVRDADGEWHPVEVYIDRHSEAEVSHGVCPNCMQEHYADVRED